MKNINSTQRVLIFVAFLTLLLPVSAIAQTKEADAVRKQFVTEAAPYRTTVRSLANTYDSRLVSDSVTDFTRAMSDLTALDSICRKFPKLTTHPSLVNSNMLVMRPLDWCRMAAQRNEIIKKARTTMARQDARPLLQNWIRKLIIEDRKRVTDDEARLDDDVQLLLFDRTAWEKQEAVAVSKRFTDLGEQMPGDVFDEVYNLADKLKAHIDRIAPERVWTQPPYKDAAVESFIKTKFPAAPEFKGAKVVKIGLDYTTWKKRESVSYVGSDSKYAYYKVSYNTYKRGVALIRMPNQPFCQAREWIVGRGAKGIVLVSLGGSGIFMKCQ